MKTTIQSTARALSVAVAASFLAIACAKNQQGVPVTIIPPNPQQKSMIDCAATKMTTQMKPRVLKPRPVCRLNEKGEQVDVDVTPRFLVGAKGKPIKTIALGARIGVRVEALKKDLDSEARFVGMLEKVCVPKIQSVFSNPVLKTRLMLRLWRADDRIDGTSGRRESAAEMEKRLANKIAKNGQSKPAIEEEPNAPESELAQGDLHMVIDFVPVTKKVTEKTAEGESEKEVENGFAIAGQVDAVASGPYPAEGKYANGSPEEAQILQFCVQVGQRIAETFGMTKGLTCSEREYSTKTVSKNSEWAPGELNEDKVTAKGTRPTGLKKMDKSGDAKRFLEKGSLDKEEFDEIVEPICK